MAAIKKPICALGIIGIFTSMKSRNLLKLLRVFAVFCFVFSLSVLFSCGGGGGGDGSADAEPTPPPSAAASLTIGTAGGEITKTGHAWTYGVKYVIAPGALTEDRVFSTVYRPEGEHPEPPVGFTPYPNRHGCTGLAVSGDKIYGRNLTISFPVKDMTVAADEKPCAISYDGRLSKWIIILPDSIDANTMTVSTTYRDYWMWGKIDLNVIASDHMIGAVKERYGEEMWTRSTSAVAQAIAILQTLYVDRNCASWSKLRDVDLPKLIQQEKATLLAYQSQLGSCGTCDLLSLQFGTELFKYVNARMAMLARDLWAQMVGNNGDYAYGSEFLGLCDATYALQWLIADLIIKHQLCDYSCVTEKFGLEIYAHYAMHNVYLVTQFLVAFALDEGLIPCQQAYITGPMNSLLAYREPGVYRIGQYHPFSFGNALAGWSVANDRFHPDSIVDKQKMDTLQRQLARHCRKACRG